MTKTYKMALVAILSAVSFLLMYLKFPLIPTASFLEIDFSIIPVLVGLCLLGLKSSFAILGIRTLLKIFLNNSGPSTLIGLPMNVIALGIFIVALSFIWLKHPSKKTYMLASLVGSLGLTGAMLVLNLVYAIPLYARFAHFDIAKLLGISQYLLAMVLPFNLLQGLLFSLVFYGVWRVLAPYTKKM